MRRSQRGAAVWSLVVSAVVAARGPEGAEQVVASLMRKAADGPASVRAWLSGAGVVNPRTVARIEAALTDLGQPRDKARPSRVVARARKVVSKACSDPKRVMVSSTL